jgi:group I intron endonuclease
MNIYTVYKITNLVNQKIYIGYTSKTPEERFKGHVYGALKNPDSHYRLARAIRKHGPENFITEPLYQSLDKNHITREMEDFFIQQYSSMDERVGYNMAPGGQGGDIKSKEQKQQLIERLQVDNPSFRKEVRESISNTVSELHKSGHYKNNENWMRTFEQNKQRFIENNPGKNKSPETLDKLSKSQKRRYEERPESFCFGERNRWHGTNGVFYSKDEEWQNKQRKRSSNLRNSEVHKCPCCDRTIKTNANFFKHLRTRHGYTDEIIESVRASLFQNSWPL